MSSHGRTCSSSALPALRARPRRCTSIDTYDGVKLFESHLTTPEAIELGERLYNMKTSGIRAAAMEVSSQDLKYDRTWGVRFKYGVFTNF